MARETKAKFPKRVAVAALALLLVPAAAWAAVQLTDGTSTAQIGSTSKGLKVEIYDSRGNPMGQKITYSAATTNATATAAGTNVFSGMCGSATKTVRVQRVNVNATIATAATRSNVIIKKTSTATSGGTATALTAVPHDSNSAGASATLINFYTALATPGSAVGVIGSQVRNFPITGTIAMTDWIPELFWNFGDSTDETEAIVLRGTAQCVEMSFAATTTNAPTVNIRWTWTEE